MIQVLYIDDEVGTPKLASRFEMMEEEGLRVVPVRSVDSVLPTLSEYEDKIDIIIVDMIMPPEDFYTLKETDNGTATGRMVVKDIRRVNKNVPIVFFSISRRRPGRKFLERYKVYEYIEKPIETERLIRIIRRIVAHCQRGMLD